LICVPATVAQDVALVGAGSSVPLPLYRKWADLYNQSNKTVQLQYLPLGTTEGIKQISNGTSDFGAGETPLTVEERREGNLTELPVVLIGIVPIYNLPGVPQLRVSGEVLAEVYLGRIKNWDDPSIAKLNPLVALPSMSIKVIYRPAGKGSNYVFTDFLSKVSVRFRDQIGRTPSPKWPVGEPAERSSDIADRVKSNPGAIGYVELQYANDNNITHASVLNPAGKFVRATTGSITAACVAVESPGWDNLVASLTNAPGADSYPIASFTRMYVRPSPKGQRRTEALVAFLYWAYSDGQKAAIRLGYSELPEPLVVRVKAKIGGLR
jgi:phosphate transport system substrate-binding protein